MRPGSSRPLCRKLSRPHRPQSRSKLPEGLIPVTLSLGVVALEDLRDLKSETLVRVADAALYRAKIAGRNRVALATAQDD